MLKMIQIRNVPDELHGMQKAKGAGLEITRSNYLLSEIEQVVREVYLERDDGAPAWLRTG